MRLSAAAQARAPRARRPQRPASGTFGAEARFYERRASALEEPEGAVPGSFLPLGVPAQPRERPARQPYKLQLRQPELPVHGYAPRSFSKAAPETAKPKPPLERNPYQKPIGVTNLSLEL